MWWEYLIYIPIIGTILYAVLTAIRDVNRSKGASGKLGSSIETDIFWSKFTVWFIIAFSLVWLVLLIWGLFFRK